MLIGLFITLLASAFSFSPSATRSVKKARFVPPAVPTMATRGAQNPWALRMAEEEKNFYDDEKEPEVKKEGISDSMKAKLMAEAGTGLDPNKAQTNVLLYIIAGVAVLVLLGGQGVLY